MTKEEYVKKIVALRKQYSGHKAVIDQLFIEQNKKYSIGDSAAFFDWADENIKTGVIKGIRCESGNISYNFEVDGYEAVWCDHVDVK